MSDLKHLSYDQLCEREEHYRQQLGVLNGKVNNKKTQLEWASKYKEEKKPKTLDFTRLPVDTLVRFKGELHYTTERDYRGARVSVSGVDSTVAKERQHQLSSDTYMNNKMQVDSCDLELVEGRKVVWEGNKCPLPNGVEVRVGFRRGMASNSVGNCSSFLWNSTCKDQDIIWYQITGRVV